MQMNQLSERIAGVLAEFDELSVGIAGHQVFDKLREQIPTEIPLEELPLEVRAELFAFSIPEKRWTAQRRSEAEEYYCVSEDLIRILI